LRGHAETTDRSELFGYRNGAFTGAGRTSAACLKHNRGTIFLDEIGELSPPIQVKLLRVLQERTYRALGSTEERSIDVRIIDATNKNLEDEVMAGRFREDLYYRLNVINIRMPALRERKADIPLLAQHFLEKYSRIMNKDVIKVSAYGLDICQLRFSGQRPANWRTSSSARWPSISEQRSARSLTMPLSSAGWEDFDSEVAAGHPA
jgi:two-component system response regulator PilR (NtrC family)